MKEKGNFYPKAQSKGLVNMAAQTYKLTALEVETNLGYTVRLFLKSKTKQKLTPTHAYTCMHECTHTPHKHTHTLG